MVIPKEFNGLVAQFIKWLSPLLTDENLLLGAKWIMERALERALSDPDKRAETVKLAREIVAEVLDFLDTLELENE